jgi:hypothetical protein
MKPNNSYKDIPVTQLHVNTANDRHGELTDETESINWMLRSLPDRMRKLAKDIAVGVVYDPPLVSNESGSFVVHDGNRRVSTVKLLNNPSLAKDEKWRNFFESLKLQHSQNIPQQLHCRVEADRDIIDDIVFRRHAGGASGVGQLDWDAEGKENHMRRTGKDHKPNLAFELQKLLREEGLLAENEKIPLSNFNRLLSSEALRSRTGFSFKGGKLSFTHDKAKVLEALRRIVSDLVSKEVVLEDIWSNKDKNAYLDNLKSQNILPNKEDETEEKEAEDEQADPTNDSSNDNDASKKKKSKKRKKPRRLTLIPKDLDIEYDKSPDLARTKDVINELQTVLYLDKHINAISVLFRVTIEMCVDYYNDTLSLQSKHGDKLHKKIETALIDMDTKGIIDKKHVGTLKKFGQKEEIISAHTFNGYVHNRHSMPSEQHLQAMWDTFQPFILNCVRANSFTP